MKQNIPHLKCIRRRNSIELQLDMYLTDRDLSLRGRDEMRRLLAEVAAKPTVASFDAVGRDTVLAKEIPAHFERQLISGVCSILSEEANLEEALETLPWSRKTKAAVN